MHTSFDGIIFEIILRIAYVTNAGHSAVANKIKKDSDLEIANVHAFIFGCFLKINLLVLFTVYNARQRGK